MQSFVKVSRQIAAGFNQACPPLKDQKARALFLKPDEEAKRLKLNS